MRHNPPRATRRTGAIAPMAALLLIPLIAMIAFAVDLGYIVQVKTDLQHTADSAALAGAQALMNPYVLWSVPNSSKDIIRSTAIAAARRAAKEYAAYNVAGGVPITLTDADIECGFLDGQGNYTATPASSTFPNTVRVMARRDGQANSPARLFFAPVIGMPTVELQTTARATIYSGRITGFRTVSDFGAGLLPMAYDVVDWDNFIRTGQDQWGGQQVDAQGQPQLTVYDDSTKDKGNFRELALDDEHAGSSDIRYWIEHALPATGIQTLQDRGLIPLTSRPPSTRPTSWDWLGNPGFKATTVQEVNTQIGGEFILPLYEAYSRPSGGSGEYNAGLGGGSDYNYNIVRFVSIRILAPERTNRQIVVQPSGHVDSLAVFDTATVVPAGSSSETGETRFSLTTPKLTQ